jgi:hypothetical protein
VEGASGVTDGSGKLLSIVGPGRSGTTVLGEILGEVEGVFDAGELRWIWRRGVVEQRKCGCGLPIPECPIWKRVLGRTQERGCGAGEAFRTETVIDLQRRIGRRRNRPRVLAGADPASSAPDELQRYAVVMAALYGAVRDVTGARLTVDTSKRAVDAAVASRAWGRDHYMLHVVRDPRAVAYSWKRVKANPSSDLAPVLSRRTTLASAGRWVENSLGAEALRRRVPPDRYYFLRYEDFARQPASTIRAILSFVDEDFASSPVSEQGVVSLGGNHTVAGNPDRFRTGEVVIREDVAWQRGLPSRDRLVVEALTLPFLRRYGYPLHQR